ncbi:Ku protein [Aestuariivirga litoralis]|uniref:non-homologous end joining protein Ku n=1 Tax=Aestuariivirga litoralis TaxID=2650924 RepID=UPI0018C699D0|nr:Ku protein [Aestuariivirga litoralis]MBG1233396.1 Ku protein [Aestuariivirga litoralis]
MPGRTFWKGHLRLALVTIPVQMVTATKTDAEIHFHQIDRDSKKRIKYVKTAPGVGEVANENIVKGFEVEPGNYVLLEDDEIDSLKLETRHTIELTEFVDVCAIDPLYFDRPYYLLPDGDVAEEGFRVIRDALRDEGKAGIGQLTLRGKENLISLKASGAGLLLETLRYESEIKEADDVFAGIGKSKLKPELTEMARDLIAKRTTNFDPSKFKNHYAAALRELVNAKLKHGKVKVDDNEEKSAPVIDFMEALRNSVGKGEKKKAAAPAKTAAKKRAKAS